MRNTVLEVSRDAFLKNYETIVIPNGIEKIGCCVLVGLKNCVIQHAYSKKTKNNCDSKGCILKEHFHPAFLPSA